MADDPASAPSRIRVAFPAPAATGPTTPAAGAAPAATRQAAPGSATTSPARADRDHVALVTLDRPDALNALDFALLAELVEALQALDRDPACHVIVLTGAGDRAFAAGADIKELAAQTPVTLVVDDPFRAWDELKRIRTPLIAAVRGHALGGGCELAMLCDMIVAGEDARFGQPEIRLGVMPGAGGTQRLTRAIGKAKAMELILTGRTMTAQEADACGLVTRVVPSETTLDEALALADRIAAMPPVAVLAATEAIDRAYELSLDAGLELERRDFFLLFASDDQREGMAAFIEKRPAVWRGR
jgi:enoyl-CoA hydratase